MRSAPDSHSELHIPSSGRIVSKLLMRMEELLDSDAPLDSKEIKGLTSALRELSELRGAERNTQTRLEVCFLGETEALSR